MFAQLPELVKKEVLYYLQVNDFPKAKAIHDAWLETQSISREYSFDNLDEDKHDA